MKDELIILNSRERKHIRQALTEQFGVSEIPDLIYFCLNKKEKVYVINKEVFELPIDHLRLNTFGLYFGMFMKDGFRLSIEGSQIIGPKAKQQIYTMSKRERDDWLKGKDLETKTDDFERLYMLMLFEKDFIGVGKAKNGKILNYIPKSRTLTNIFSAEENCVQCE